MLSAGAQGQHPPMSPVLGQCQITHLHIREKTLVVIYTTLHHLICIDFSQLWGQIREKGSLHTTFSRLCKPEKKAPRAVRQLEHFTENAEGVSK